VDEKGNSDRERDPANEANSEVVREVTGTVGGTPWGVKARRMRGFVVGSTTREARASSILLRPMDSSYILS